MDAQKLKIILLKILATLFLLGVCGTVISQGVRTVNPAFAWKLAKLPGLSFLGNFQGWHRLDLANVMAVGLLVVEYFVLVTALRYFLVPGTMENRHKLDWNVINDRILTWLGFVGLTVGEAMLFFVGAMSNESGWDGSSPLTAFLGALLYMLTIVFVAYFTVRIERGLNHD